MRSPGVILALLLVALRGRSLDAQSELPAPVAAGLAAVKAGSYDSAVDEWTKA